MPLVSHSSAWSAAPRAHRGTWVGPTGSTSPDPFAINPIRRSLGVVAVSTLILFGAPLLGEPAATAVLLSLGWLAMTGLVMGLPILIWSLAEEAWRRTRRRFDPPIDLLDLPPRLHHVLHRHGYESISLVERTPDTTLLLLSNMDPRGLREIRRAISLWRYRRWQEAGFR